MGKTKASELKIHWGVFFASAFTILSFSACGGSVVSSTATPSAPPIPQSTPAQPSIGSIASVVAAAVNEPYIAGNNSQYYCDCTGPGATCATSGSDAGAGTQNSPYQTLDKAMAWLVGGTNRTVALCKGGSFTSAHTGQFVYTLAAISCPAGTICNELREYGTSGAKPIVNNPIGNRYLFSTANNAGGYRFMNLKLQGTWATTSGQSNLGFFLWADPGYKIHDITIENVDMDSFNLAIQDATYINNNITITGNHFTNNSTFAYLGGSSNLTLSYNSFINNGSDNKFDHAVYLGTNSPVTNVSIVGNFISGFSTASGNTNCMGPPFTAHASVTNLIVSGNVIVEGTNADPGCWGFDVNNFTNATGAIFFRNALFSNNIIVNGGNNGMNVGSCPYCVIQNNLIIFQNNAEAAGIASPSGVARTTSGDDVETNATIVNNTIYFNSTSSQGMKGGVWVGWEGTGHVVANNTTFYAGTTHGSNMVNCHTYSLPITSYSFINNNNCFSNDPSTKWVFNGVTQYTLAGWQTASSFDANSSLANPLWTAPPPTPIPALDETKTGAQIFHTTRWLAADWCRKRCQSPSS